MDAVLLYQRADETETVRPAAGPLTFLLIDFK